jgi:hypothetical protein
MRVTNTHIANARPHANPTPKASRSQSAFTVVSVMADDREQLQVFARRLEDGLHVDEHTTIAVRSGSGGS